VKTVEFLMCDTCGGAIFKPEHGVILRGVLEAADLGESRVLVGAPLQAHPEGNIPVSAVAVCKSCLLKALGWDKKSPDQWPSRQPPHPGDGGRRAVDT
jgi:hypothetical protein